jgi:hypothetical protein
MKIDAIERMSPMQRRKFLRYLAMGAAAPGVPFAVRYAINELAGGKAYAQAPEPTFFIELCLRDQWDQGHVFVAPGLATHTGLRKGQNGDQAAVFYTDGELQHFPAQNVYLTADSMALAPYLDSIAFLDTCQPSLGAIHGHEGMNEIRSPGRNYTNRAGTMAVYENDPVTNFPQGCEEFYSSTPTPASLHNYYQKQLEPTLRNGIAFKGISRSIHTAYHFGAGLPGAELDRMRSRDQLFEQFPSFVEDVNIVPTADQALALTEIMKRLDRRFLERHGYIEHVRTNHITNIDSSRDLLYVAEPRVVSLPLTPEEETYWGTDVPGQMCTSGDTESFECDDGTVKAQIWEQCAYAVKLLRSGLTRTVALEFDYMDLHGFRPEIAVRTQAKQLSYPLARMIEQLQAAGIYDRTIIAVYCADGSRSPAGNSYGDTGDAKNTLILAGGAIKGGYYGDFVIAGDTGDGHEYGHRAPDPDSRDGALLPMARGREGRTSSADAWRTVMKALRIPDELAGSFPDVAGGRPLNFVFRDPVR